MWSRWLRRCCVWCWTVCLLPTSVQCFDGMDAPWCLNLVVWPGGHACAWQVQGAEMNLQQGLRTAERVWSVLLVQLC